MSLFKFSDFHSLVKLAVTEFECSSYCLIFGWGCANAHYTPPTLMHMLLYWELLVTIKYQLKREPCSTVYRRGEKLFSSAGHIGPLLTQKSSSRAGCGPQVRPCVRRNFSNFLFLQVSEMFGCQSSEFFWKKPEIFAKKFGKKFGNLSLEKSLDINRNCKSISKISKKLCKVWVFESKNPVFGSKSLEKFKKVLVIVRKLGFPNVGKFRKLFYSKLSKNYEKMTLNSNFGNREKLVPTGKPTRKFG